MTSCGNMTIPSQMNLTAFKRTDSKMHTVYIKIANQTMTEAANEMNKKVLGESSEIEETVIDTHASFDDTWQQCCDCDVS